MADDSPVGSPLSTLSSDVFDPEEEHERIAAPVPPARKRQKVSDAKDSKDSATPPRFAFDDDTLEGMAISSDSSGEVPNSPGGGYRFDEDDFHEQVTACIWEGCKAGDLGNMDSLVKHIHNEHIESKGKNGCKWMDCTRKGVAHASAYALRAHMRSHTREKPFYCELPECDRAFTRSDALAKHYRTVHETEALRPSDPIPKSMQVNRTPRVKPKEHAMQPHPDVFVDFGSKTDDRWASSYPVELGFTEDDEARGAKELYRLLRRQIHWAEEDSDQLKRQCDALEDLRKREWLEKELLLDQAIQGERDYHERRILVKSGMADIPSNQEIKLAVDRSMSNAYSPPNVNPSSPTPLPGPSQPVAEARETAAILASMHDQS